MPNTPFCALMDEIILFIRLPYPRGLGTRTTATTAIWRTSRRRALFSTNLRTCALILSSMSKYWKCFTPVCSGFSRKIPARRQRKTELSDQPTRPGNHPRQRRAKRIRAKLKLPQRFQQQYPQRVAPVALLRAVSSRGRCYFSALPVVPVSRCRGAGAVTAAPALSSPANNRATEPPTGLPKTSS